MTSTTAHRSAGLPGRGAGCVAGRAGRPPGVRGPVDGAGGALGRDCTRSRTRRTRRRASSRRRPSPVRGRRRSMSSASPRSRPCWDDLRLGAGRSSPTSSSSRYRLPQSVGRGPGGLRDAVAGAGHRADHRRPHPGGRDVRGRADRLVRQPGHPVAAGAAGRPRPGAVHARPAGSRGSRTAADKRHVTFDTDQVSFDGTMHLEADLEVPDALGLAEAVVRGCRPPRGARVHRHRRRAPRHRAR